MMLRTSAYAVAAGLFFSVPFVADFIPGLAFVALVPFFSLIFIPVKNNRYLFFLGWLAGTVAFCVYLSWFFSALPLDWAGIRTGAFVFGAAALTLFLAGAYFGLFFGAFLVIVKKYALKNAAFFSMAALIVWPLLEYLRTFLFSFHPYIIGPGLIVGDHAGFMLLGHLLAPYAPLRVLADIFGPYGLGVIILISNCIILLLLLKLWLWLRTRGIHDMASKTCLFHNDQFLLTAVCCLTFLFIALTALGAWLRTHPQEIAREVRIAIVQTAFPEHASWIDEITAKRISEEEEVAARTLIEQALSTGADIVVAPEGTPSVFDTPDFEPYPSFEEITDKLGTSAYRVVIDTAHPPRKWERHKNQTSVFDNRSGLLGTYQKQFLMPWGEYIPWLSSFGAWARGFSWNDAIVSLVPGNQHGVFATELGKIGVLTCSEILSPRLIKKTAQQGADIIIVASSDAVFHRSELLQKHILSMAQIHAASIKKPLIYSGNEAHSFALDALGNILWKSNAFENSVEMVTVGIGTEN